MKTVVTVMATIAALVVLAGGALAFMAPGHGMMMQMGPRMMAQGAGPMGPGMHGGAMNGTQVSEDQARALAQKYVDEQLKGFSAPSVM